MIIEQKMFTTKKGWQFINEFDKKVEPQLVMIFGSVTNCINKTLIDQIKKMYPESSFIGCTTSGEIGNGFVIDESIITTAIYFEKSTIQSKFITIENAKNSFQAGKNLINQLPIENLKHIFVLSDGLNVNGTKLVEGMQTVLPENVNVTGGLAGDADLFSQTFVILPDGDVQKNVIASIGIYGNDFKVGYGSYGGWDIFGVERIVTKSIDNVLYEIDNAPALALYKSFLGELSNNLPASALLFPLSLRTDADEEAVVRTILAVNEEDQSLTFAGDIPEGGHVKLMKANVDRLIDGAIIAAERAKETIGDAVPELAILVSCVGRKLVLKQEVDEEIESVKNVLGENVILNGFYSYGEIAPFAKKSKCALHNQTMTITVFSEK